MRLVALDALLGLYGALMFWPSSAYVLRMAVLCCAALPHTAISVIFSEPFEESLRSCRRLALLKIKTSFFDCLVGRC